jgi:hypothetical protein
MNDTSVCVDDDCPLPEHTGPCPDHRTLEMWRTEAQRCRAMIGRLINRIKYQDESIARYRQMRRPPMEGIATKPVELQNDRPCCECGKQLERGTIQMSAVVPVQHGSIRCTQRIVWCEGCWGEMPFPKPEPVSWDGLDGPCCE